MGGVSRAVFPAGGCGPAPLGDAEDGSDPALSVDPTEGTTLFDLAAIELELEKRLGIPVHVLTSGALRDGLRKHVLAEAQPV